jgi:chemotaxis methyl-accepting protein methylase
MNDQDIVAALEKEFVVDISGYQTTFFSHRLARRMTERGCTLVQDYLELLRTDEGMELSVLLDSLSITVSSFFRDPLLFEYLAAIVLPPLIDEIQRKRIPRLRIWSAGCSAGQEAYSLAMLFAELRHPQVEKVTLTLLGTDIDGDVLARAHHGLYSERDVENVTMARLKQHFTVKGEWYTVKPDIRQLVHFSNHDLLDTVRTVPPDSLFGLFDIIFCMNLLMYYNSDVQLQIFRKLDAALIVGGYLSLGSSEYIPELYRELYSQPVPRMGLFQKLESISSIRS